MTLDPTGYFACPICGKTAVREDRDGETVFCCPDVMCYATNKAPPVATDILAEHEAALYARLKLTQTFVTPSGERHETILDAYESMVCKDLEDSWEKDPESHRSRSTGTTVRDFEDAMKFFKTHRERIDLYLAILDRMSTK